MAFPRLPECEALVSAAPDKLVVAGESIVEYQVVGVSDAGEGSEENPWRGGGVIDVDSDFVQCHTLRFPGGECPGESEWIHGA